MLGTAQLGLPYGIANSSGSPTREQALELIEAAWTGGIRSFDTAQSYGNSEQILGDCLNSVGIKRNAQVITKLAKEAFENEDAAFISIGKSLSNLKMDRIFGVLSHHPTFNDIPMEKYQQIFSFLKKENVIRFSGISVYSGQDALDAIHCEHMDIIQMPLNVWDRSAVEMGLMKKAKAQGKLLVFRSIFLQGLLTMTPEDLPSHMLFASDAVKDWRKFCLLRNISPIDAALQIALELAEGFPLLIGAEKTQQISENLNSAKNNFGSRKELTQSSIQLSLNSSPRLRNPSLWRN